MNPQTFHPQSYMSPRSLQIACATVLLCAVILSWFYLAPSARGDSRQRTARSPQSAAADQRFAKTAGRGSVAFTQPYRTIELSAAEPGLVAEMRIHRGKHVRKGDLLCELDVSALQAHRATVVHKYGSTASRDALRVEMDRLDRRLKSIRSLIRQGGGTPEELATAEAEAVIAGLRVQAADEELEGGKLAISEIDPRIEARRIRAVMDGIIIDVHRDIGEFVSSVDPSIATLVDLTRLRAAFFLPTQAAAELNEGESTTIRFPETGQQTSCLIDYVGPLTHADSGRVRVDVVIDNPAQEFRSGLQCVLPHLTSFEPRASLPARKRSAQTRSALRSATLWTPPGSQDDFSTGIR